MVQGRRRGPFWPPRRPSFPPRFLRLELFSRPRPPWPAWRPAGGKGSGSRVGEGRVDFLRVGCTESRGERPKHQRQAVDATPGRWRGNRGVRDPRPFEDGASEDDSADAAPRLGLLEGRVLRRLLRGRGLWGHQPVSQGTETFVNLHAIEQTRSQGQRRVDGVESPRHRADSVTGPTSRRWRGAPEL